MEGDSRTSVADVRVFYCTFTCACKIDCVRRGNILLDCCGAVHDIQVILVQVQATAIMAPAVQASTKVRSACEWLADLQRARVSAISRRTQTARFCIMRTNQHTGEGCKAAGLCMQAEATRGERSKVTIADVIERVDGDHHPSRQLWAHQAQALHLKRAACQCLRHKKMPLFLIHPVMQPKGCLHSSLHLVFCTARRVLIEPNEPPSPYVVVTAAWDALCRPTGKGSQEPTSPRFVEVCLRLNFEFSET